MKLSISPRSLRLQRTNICSMRLLTTLPVRANKTFLPKPTQFQPKMSFSNTNTGDKPSDPYTENNKDETSIKEKVEDLTEFIKACKFGMMTTRHGSDGALVSRCMALAGTVRLTLISHNINPNSWTGK